MMSQKLSSKLLFRYSPNTDGLYTFYVSQRSVATQLRCGGMFSNHFTTNFSQNAAVKKFWRSVNIWQRYGKNFVAYFLGGMHPVCINSKFCLSDVCLSGLRPCTSSPASYQHLVTVFHCPFIQSRRVDAGVLITGEFGSWEDGALCSGTSVSWTSQRTERIPVQTWYSQRRQRCQVRSMWHRTLLTSYKSYLGFHTTKFKVFWLTRLIERTANNVGWLMQMFRRQSNHINPSFLLLMIKMFIHWETEKVKHQITTNRQNRTAKKTENELLHSGPKV